jgi:hypothetical protein
MYQDSQRASKSLAAATPTSYAAAKHMLFLPTLNYNLMAFMFHYDLSIPVKTLKSIYLAYSFN